MAAEKAAFKLWKPRWTCYLRRALLSESFAWAVQNAAGVLFTILFSVVGQMTFSLACINAALYSAGSQVLSLDRTIGGRLFGGVVFLGCMLSSGLLGGVLSTLAWLARGDASGLLEYLPASLQKIPSRPTIGRVTEYLPRAAALPLPQFVREEAQNVLDLIGSDFPEFSPAFWALLIVLFAVVSVPFAVGRASDDYRFGILMAIATLFMGSQVIFATLMPTLGLRLYWTQITLGYVKVALVNAGAMIITGILFLAASTHDAIRMRLGDVLQDAGKLLSGIASDINRPWDKTVPHTAVARSELEIIDAFRQEAHARAGGVSIIDADVDKVTLNKDTIDELEAGTAVAVPGPKSGLELQGDLYEIKSLFASALFEPPLPGLVSQPGANRSKYLKLHSRIAEVVNIAQALAAAVPAAQYELAMQDQGGNGNGQINDAVAVVVASCAAACADVSVALQHMPLWRACSGETISWRPCDTSFWSELTARLHAASLELPPLLSGEKASAAVLLEGRSLLVMLTGCDVLISMVRELETAAAIALDIPLGSGVADVNSKEENGGVNGEVVAGVISAPAPAASTVKERIKGNAYAPSILVLTAVSTGLPVWFILVKSISSMWHGAVVCARSKTACRQALANRNVQFAMKYWGALALTVMGIILLLWKGEGDSGNPPQDAYNITYFFFIWQPVYFWITAAICIQKNVEAAASRAVLRAVLTGVGGVLGYVTMLNGSLANNPYFVTGITCAFNAICGLASPIKSLRYSLFLAAFTFNATVICQYYGCCDIAGDPKVFGGKVLSTLLGAIYAVLVSWCIAPYYTSEVMLRYEADALQCGVQVLGDMHAAVETVAAGADAGAAVDSCKDSSGAALVECKVDWSDEVDHGMHEPLGLVRKELEMDTVDRRQLPLTWLFLPTPRVVELLLQRINTLATSLQTANQVLRSTLWPGDAGPAQAALLASMRPHVHAVLAAAGIVAETARDCMAATSRIDVDSTRESVSVAVSSLEEARATMRGAFLAWSGPEWTAPDLRFLAWMHLLLLAVQEVEVVGIVLSKTEAALERDRNSAWLSSWFGRRPAG